MLSQLTGGTHQDGQKRFGVPPDNNPEDYYCRCGVAQEILHQRRDVRNQVESWWQQQGWDVTKILPVLNVAPAAFLARQVATARYEDVLFAGMAEQMKLRPVWLEYAADRFHYTSSYKRSLLHRRIYHGRGRNGGIQLSVERLLPFESSLRESLRDIFFPQQNQSLVDYHHGLQDALWPGAARFDVSELYAQAKRTTGEYYLFLLSLAVAHGVLIEDFHAGESGDQLASFTRKVFEPAFHAVTGLFGHPPLIVRLPWVEQLAYYPATASLSKVEWVGYE